MAEENDHEPATKGDVRAVAGDLSKAAGDLSKVAGDLSKVAGDLTKVATELRKVTIEVVNLKADVRDIRQTMSTKDDISRVLEAIDSFTGKAVAYDNKSLSHGAILTDHEDKLRDHGRRLSSLESKP